MYYKYVLILFLFSACNTVQDNQKVNVKEVSPKVKTVALSEGKNGEPSPKEALYLLMQQHNVPLSIHESCNGVGTDFDDTTIGQYISGFWVYHADDESINNDLYIEVLEGTDEKITAKHWTAIVRLSGEMEGDPWNWGVSFSIMDEGHEVVKESFRCLGEG